MAHLLLETGVRITRDSRMHCVMVDDCRSCFLYLDQVSGNRRGKSDEQNNLNNRLMEVNCDPCSDSNLSCTLQRLALRLCTVSG